MKTESKTYPKILRSRREKMIFFPDKIQEIQREMEEEVETFYQYNLIRVPDIGQQIKNYDLFKKENYAELRKNAYGSWQDQFEIMHEQGFTSWQDYCDQIKIEYVK